MPWWAWLLLGWGGAALVCAVWWGRALAHAEQQERAHRPVTVERCEVPVDEFRRPHRHSGAPAEAASIPHARRPILHRRRTPSQ